MAFIKKYWLMVSAVCLVLTVVIIIGVPYAPGGGFMEKLDSILPKDRNNFDFTRTVISLSALADPGTDLEWTEKELDNMAAALKKAIGDEGNPAKVINAFNHYFFDLKGFVFDEKFTAAAEKGGDIAIEELRGFHSIEKTLKRNRGICLSISLIYLMLGDKLGLPLYGVLIPGHIYVRYKEPGRSGINVETTVSGAEYYGYTGMAPAFDGKKTPYGRELDKYSVTGAYLLNLGSYFISIGENKKARVLFERSVEMLPGAAESYINLGILYEQEKKPVLAAENYAKSLELLPSGFAHYRLGAIYLADQRFTKAQEHLEAAIKAKTGGDDAIKLLEEAKKRGG